MSDPRDFERDPNLSGNRDLGRQSGAGDNSGWIIAVVIAAVLLGLAAYSYRGKQMTSANAPGTLRVRARRRPSPTHRPRLRLPPRSRARKGRLLPKSSCVIFLFLPQRDGGNGPHRPRLGGFGRSLASVEAT